MSKIVTFEVETVIIKKQHVHSLNVDKNMKCLFPNLIPDLCYDSTTPTYVWAENALTITMFINNVDGE